MISVDPCSKLEEYAKFTAHICIYNFVQKVVNHFYRYAKSDNRVKVH